MTATAEVTTLRRDASRSSATEARDLNQAAQLSYELRLQDFEIAMQDVYDLFFDVNSGLLEKGLERLDDFLRPAIMSGLISDLLTAASRSMPGP